MKTFIILITLSAFSHICYSQKTLTIDSVSIKKTQKQEIKIRCMATISNDKGPLFIIDGVPLSSDDKALELLNPDNVKSIEVLKETSFLCYGPRSSNGIVLISTKEYTPLVKTKEYPFKTYKVCNDNWNITQDVYNAIQAKVPGVSISTNANLNATPNIRMRGDDNTIVIVDGIRYDASILNTLNPSNIESITVAPSVAASNYLGNR